jgi:putative peptidoglycan lipid II flippase
VSRIARAAGRISAATLVSRVLGLLRDSIRAALVGARGISDALGTAYLIPNLLRDLFAEGAFSGAFVPALSKAREDRGSEGAFLLLNRVFSTLLVYIGAIVLLIALFAPDLVALLTSKAFRADAELVETTVSLVRLLAPFLLFISLAAAAMGALNVFGRYFLPALSPATQNAVLVIGGVLLLQLALSESEAAIPWAVLLLVGGFMQFAIQLPALLRLGWRPRFLPDLVLRTDEVRLILRRMLPVVGGMAATHASILINWRLATNFYGGPSNLYYAFRLVHLPVGLVGVAVGTAVLAEASRRVAKKDLEGVRSALGEALLLTLVFAVPAAAGLFVLGEPIARVLFMHGHLDAGNASAIGTTILFYAPAVVFYACVKVVAPVFFAQGRVGVPLVASLVAVVANLATALTLHYFTDLRWLGLALAVGFGQAANLAVLLFHARRQFGRPDRRHFEAVWKIALSACLCALAAHEVWRWMPDGDGLVDRLVAALVPVLAGAAAYFGAGRVLRCHEMARALRLSRGLDKAEIRP